MNELNQSQSLQQPKASCWALIRRVLLIPIWVVTLIALFYGVENWRGHHAWQRYKREMAAQGEPLELAALIPPRVPDEKNFAMTPFLAPLFDYTLPVQPGQSMWRDTNAFNRVSQFANLELQAIDAGATNLATALEDPAHPPNRALAAQSILRQLEKCSPVLEELRAARRRPYSRFNIHYGEAPSPPLPHLALLKRLCLVLKYRALAELALNQPQAALDDVQLCLHGIDAVRSEPFLISHLVRVAGFQIILPAVQDALAAHRWSEAQLEALQARLAQLDFIADCQLAMRSERINVNLHLEQLWKDREQVTANDDTKTLLIAVIAPRGWYLRNMVAYDRFFQEAAFPALDCAARRVYPQRVQAAQTVLEHAFAKVTPYNILAGFVARMNSPDRSLLKFALAQSLADQATVSVALERSRLATGQYPESLEALSPRFLKHLPHDLLSGQPLKYHRTAEGHFALYSVGWNETDDDGTIAVSSRKTPHRDYRQGDWVWNQPPPP